MTSSKNAGKNAGKETESRVRICSGLKGGRLSANHTRAGLKVAAGVKGGRLAANHTHAGLKVATGLKGGKLAANHTRAGLKVATSGALGRAILARSEWLRQRRRPRGNAGVLYCLLHHVHRRRLCGAGICERQCMTDRRMRSCRAAPASCQTAIKGYYDAETSRRTSGNTACVWLCSS